MRADYTKTALGTRVAEYRRARGFKTQKALADAVPGLSPSTVINIEAGRKADPSIRDLLLIAWGLKVSPLALLFDVNKPYAPSDQPELLPEDWRDVPVIGLIDFIDFSVNMTPAGSDGENPLQDPSYKVELVRGLRSLAVSIAETRRRYERFLAEGMTDTAEAFEKRIQQQQETFDTLWRTHTLSGIDLPPVPEMLINESDPRTPNGKQYPYAPAKPADQ